MHSLRKNQSYYITKLIYIMFRKAHLGIMVESSINKCFIWGNMELSTSKMGCKLLENGHHEA